MRINNRAGDMLFLVSFLHRCESSFPGMTQCVGIDQPSWMPESLQKCEKPKHKKHHHKSDENITVAQF